jgi:hypothetical protein
MRVIGFTLLLILVVGLGFLGTWALLANRDFRQSSRDVWPVNVDRDFSLPHVDRKSLGAGWAEPTAQGTWANKPESVVLIDVSSNAAGDVALFMEARSTSAGTGEQAVTVLVNGEVMGAWQMSSGNESQSAAIVVPADRFNQERPLRLTFRSEKPFLGLRRIVLHDVSSLSDFAGYVDVCQATRISGWARAGLAASPVVIKRNNAIVVPIGFRNVTRPDLPAHGVPAAAGFDITVPPAASAEETTQVLFPNGRPLNKSPCQPL